MMPGERPVAMLAEQLARTFGGEMGEVRRLLDGTSGRSPTGCAAEAG